MKFNLIIIGDEIMRGKREDKHFAKLREIFAVRNAVLNRVTLIGDNRAELVNLLRESFASENVVFSFGGIGVTPDDHTRIAAGLAAGVELELNKDAEREIRARMAEIGHEVTPARLELGTVPIGSAIIPNPVNRIPGFSFRNHHFLPGFPQMAHPMVEWVLDKYYRDQFSPTAVEVERSIIVWRAFEGDLLQLMRDIEAKYNGVIVFSLPSFGNEKMDRHIELGVRGYPEGNVLSAMKEIEAEISRRGLEFVART